jgi:hypothetical protein
VGSDSAGHTVLQPTCSVLMVCLPRWRLRWGCAMAAAQLRFFKETHAIVFTRNTARCGKLQI